MSVCLCMSPSRPPYTQLYYQLGHRERILRIDAFKHVFSTFWFEEKCVIRGLFYFKGLNGLSENPIKNLVMETKEHTCREEHQVEVPNHYTVYLQLI